MAAPGLRPGAADKLYPGQAICQLVVETMVLPVVATLDSVHQRSGG